MKRYTIGLITGVLLTASAFMFMGAQNKNLGDITVSSITIKNNEDILPYVRMNNRSINVYSEDGGGLFLGNGIIGITNEQSDFAVNLGVNDSGGGLIKIKNSNKNEALKLSTTISGGGSLKILNGKNNPVVHLSSTKNEDGLIVLNDRYGDFGWNKNGKK